MFAPHTEHPCSEELDSEYLNIFETRTRTPFFQGVYVDGVRVMLIIGRRGLESLPSSARFELTCNDVREARMRTLGVIPARLASTRLPGKVLREIAGRPMLAWVYEAARTCPQLDGLIVATDSEEVMWLCREHGWECRMTSVELASGSDRVHAVAQMVDAEIYVNIQGDEPMLRAEHLGALLAPFAREHVEVSTLKVRCGAEDVRNPNAVKVVTAGDGRALYFSRAAIPYDRDGLGEAEYWKHLGLYAYRKEALRRFAALPASMLERTERLEQLRFLENGFSLYVEETGFDTVGVDTEDDLRRVEAILRSGSPSGRPADGRLPSR